jgi:sugar phosphate isomerase/epimerase
VQIAFSSLACPGWSVEQIAEAAVRYGYDAIEWRLADGELLGPRTSDDVWESIATCGVPSVCLDTSATFVTSDAERRRKAVAISTAMGERAKQIGAPAIRVFAGQVDGDPSLLIGPTRDALAAAAATMPDAVALVIETHDAWSRGSDVMRLVPPTPKRSGGANGVGVLWDVAHSVRAGESPRETLAHIGVPGLVHVKDARGSELVHLGDGEVPLGDTIAALRDVGYDGALSLEWEKLWHPELDEPDAVLPRAVRYLRDLLGAGSSSG